MNDDLKALLKQVEKLRPNPCCEKKPMLAGGVQTMECDLNCEWQKLDLLIANVSIGSPSPAGSVSTNRDGLRVQVALLFDNGSYRTVQVDLFPAPASDSEVKSKALDCLRDTKEPGLIEASFAVIVSSRCVSYQESASEEARKLYEKTFPIARVVT